MQYSAPLILALATLHAAAMPEDPGANTQAGTVCPFNLPPTNLTFTSDDGQGDSFHMDMVICCPGVISNGGNKDNVCLIGNGCGVSQGSDGQLSTTSCVATVPITASDYAVQIASAYNAAGQPSVTQSALETGNEHGASFTQNITMTGAAAATTASIDIGGVPSASAGSITTTAAPSSSNAAVGDKAMLRPTAAPAVALVGAILGAAVF